MARFSDSFLDELRAAVPIESAVERRGVKLRRVGAERVGPCTVCGGEDRFAVNTKERVWNCRGCKVGGDVFAFLMRNGAGTFEDAVVEAAQIGGVPLPKTNGAGGRQQARAEPKRQAPQQTRAKWGDPVELYPFLDRDGAERYHTARFEWTEDGKRHKAVVPRRQVPGVAGLVWGIKADDYIKNPNNGQWYQVNEDRRRYWPGAEIQHFDEEAAILYRLPELMEELAQPQDEQRVIFCVEGERKVDLLGSWGCVATTSIGGVNGWLPHFPEYFMNADVVIMPDNDDVGRQFAHAKAASLRDVARRVRILDLRMFWPGCPTKGDVVDWAKVGEGNAGKLFDIVDQLKDWTPEIPKSELHALRFSDLDKPRRQLEWLVKTVLQRGEMSVWFGDWGCVDGQALVTINRNGAARQMKLADVVHCFNGTTSRSRSGRKWDHKIPTMIRCFVGGEFRSRQILGAYERGIKPVLRVILADRKTLRVTSDHEFLTKGGWKRADQLLVGEKVFVSGARVNPFARRQLHFAFGAKRAGRYLDKKGYWWVCDAGLKRHPQFASYKARRPTFILMEHRLVAEARLNGLSLEQWLEVIRAGAFTETHAFLRSDQHVHHKDEDTTNNEPDNLIVLTQSQHAKRHRHHRNLAVFWPEEVKVHSITKDGAVEVFDLTVADAHNFVANDIVVHNCGKSFLLTDMCFAIARGIPWFGRKTHSGLVVYQAGEGEIGFGNRMDAYRRHFQVEESIPFVALCTRINLFSSDKFADLMIAEVNAWATYYKRGAELVVIDTFSAASSGADENSGRDVGAVLERARRISHETKAHVAIVHHVPKSGGSSPRGWGGFLGNVDSAVLVQNTTELENDTRTIHKFTVIKQKDAASQFSRMFSLPQVVLGKDAEGDEITSCIVKQLDTVAESAARQECPADWAQINTNNADVFRALIKAIGKHATSPPAEVGAPRDVKAACTVAQWQAELVDMKTGFEEITPQVRKMISNRVYRALKQWVPDGKNIMDKKGIWVWRTGRKVFGVDRLPRKSEAEPAQLDMIRAPGDDPDADIPF